MAPGHAAGCSMAQARWPGCSAKATRLLPMRPLVVELPASKSRLHIPTTSSCGPGPAAARRLIRSSPGRRRRSAN